MSEKRGPEHALDAVEALARSVDPPSPPGSLQPRSPMRGMAISLAAVAILLVVMGVGITGGWWSDPGPSPTPEPGPTVVVEYVRVSGKPIVTRTADLPEVGAVVVTPASGDANPIPLTEEPSPGSSNDDPSDAAGAS